MRRTPPHRPSRPRHARRPHFEPLEPRQLLTAINSAIALGSAGDDLVTGLALDAQNTTYITGQFTGSMDANPGAAVLTLTSKGGTDIFLAAYRYGELLWAKSFGGTGDDLSGDLALAGTTLVVGGSFSATLDADPGAPTFTLTSAGSKDVFVSRFSTAGDFQSAFSFGGTAQESLSSLALDNAGNVYVQGAFAGTADFAPGPGTATRTAPANASHAYVAKYNPTGTLSFVSHFVVDGAFQSAGIAVTPDGTPVFAGSFNGTLDLDGQAGASTISSGGRFLGFITTLTPTGGLAWAKSFGHYRIGTFTPIQVYGLALDPAGNILLGGSFTGTIDIDPGTEQRLLTRPAPLVEPFADNGWGGFLMKLNSAGNHVWSGALGGGVSHITNILSDSAGNVLVTGDFLGTVDFDITATQSTVNAPSLAANAYLAKYDPAGHLVHVSRPDASNGASRATLLAVGPDFRAAVAGHFSNSLRYPTTSVGNLLVVGDTVLTSKGGFDAFLLQYAPLRLQPSIALTPSATTVTRGQGLTLTAALTGKVPPTGTVQFFDGATLLGQAPVTAGAATFALTAPLTTPGPHTLTAIYTGDGNFNPRTSAAVTVTVNIPETPVGSIDVADGGLLTGWAADYQAINAPVVLHLFINGLFRSAIVANHQRDDLQAFLGAKNHGFLYQLPPLPAGAHTVTVIAFDPVSGASSQLAATTVHSGSLYFDEAWYRRAYPDVAAAIAAGVFTSGYQHFAATGAHEGRSPSAFFDETWYRAINPDIAAAVAAGQIPSGFAHFVANGSHEGRDPSPFFSESFYRRANSDVAAAVAGGTLLSGFTHFLASGLFENRSATPWFHGTQYAAGNSDILAAIENGTLRSTYDHFVTRGVGEKRVPGPWFHEGAYLNRYPDVAAGVSAGTLPSALVHFLSSGFAEGRTSALVFDAPAYLAAHPEAQTAIANGLAKSPFQYFLLYGRLQGHTI